MRMVNRNLPRAVCACVLALATYAMPLTAEGAGSFTVLAADTAAANAIWNSRMATWEANMLSFGRTHCQTLVKKVDQYGNVQTNDMLLAATYYDAIEVYLQIYQYTKDASWLPCAGAAKLTYRDNYVMAQPTQGSVPGYWNFTTGLVLDYKINGDVVSKNAEILLSQNAAFAQDWTPLDYTADASRSREVAYAIRSYLNAEKLGEPRRARLAVLVNQQLGIIDQWFISKTFRTNPGYTAYGIPAGVYYIQPFMVGLAMEGLIMFYEASKDARVPPAVKICLDWLWANAWVPADNAFWYDNMVTDPSLPFPANTGAPDLNLLIAPAYAWYYQMTGDTTYRDKGDLIFAGGSAAYLYAAKQFNQNYSYGFQYVSRRLLAEGGTPPLSTSSTPVTPSAPSIPQALASAPATPQAPAIAPATTQASASSPATTQDPSVEKNNNSKSQGNPGAPGMRRYWKFLFGK